VISPTQRPLLNNTQDSQETDIHAPAVFQPAILESERPQTHALDSAATGIGYLLSLSAKFSQNHMKQEDSTVGKIQCFNFKTPGTLV
jgi:hypothetical protein